MDASSLYRFLQSYIVEEQLGILEDLSPLIDCLVGFQGLSYSNAVPVPLGWRRASEQLLEDVMAWDLRHGA